MKQSIKWLSPGALALMTALGCGAGLSAAYAASAEQPTIQSLSPSEVASGALTPQTVQGIRFVSGGIGIEERAWLAEHGKEFNMQVTFAVVPGGDFVADVQVKILSADGHTMLETTAHGPKFLAQLPAGQYRLAASHDGQTLSRPFTVSPSARSSLVLGFSH